MFKQAQHDEQTINVLCCNYPNEDELDNPQVVMDDVAVDTLHQVITEYIFMYIHIFYHPAMFIHETYFF